MRKPEMKEYKDHIEIILPKEFLIKNHIITDIRGTGNGFLINSTSHPIEECGQKNQKNGGWVEGEAKMDIMSEEEAQFIGEMARRALQDFMKGTGKNYLPTGANTLDSIVPKKHQPDQSENHRSIWNKIKLNQSWEQ